MRTRKKNKTLITGWLKGHQQNPEIKPKNSCLENHSQDKSPLSPLHFLSRHLDSLPSVSAQCSWLHQYFLYVGSIESIHTTQVCQNSTLFPMYDLTFSLKLSIPSFGKNFNQTLLGKINLKSGFSSLNSSLWS